MRKSSYNENMMGKPKHSGNIRPSATSHIIYDLTLVRTQAGEYITLILLTLYSLAFSPQANYTDWATTTCQRILVPNVVDGGGGSRGQRGGTPKVVNLILLL
jgi:hypothetical protein